MKIKLAPYLFPLTLSITPEITIAQEKRLEEVRVTAQKRSERLSQVPLAIDVITAETLNNSAIDSLSQLEDLAASMNFGRAGRKARGEITVRGVGDFSRNIGTDARVAVYIDDVPLGRSSSYDLKLLNIERVEILKGPQGTLFGTNSIAGAVNIITAAPSEEFTLGARVGAGNFGHQTYSIKADLPVSSSLLSRIVIGHQESEGFIENVTLNKTLQGGESDTARVKLAYTPSENFGLTLSADWMKEDDNSVNGLALSNDERFEGFDYSPGAREVAHDSLEFERRKIYGGSVNANWQLGSGMHIESISALRASEFSDQSEEDYSPMPVVSSQFDEKFDQISQEVRLISPSDNRLSYVIGTFLLTQEVTSSRGAKQGTQDVSTSGELNNDLGAIFGNVNIGLSEIASLELGLRLQRENKHLTFSITDDIGSFTNGRINEKESFDAALPRAALNFSIGETGIVYYSVAKGAKSGGWNADFVSTLSGLKFDQETATNFEIGYKNIFADSRAQISIAAFKTNLRDFQVLQFISRENEQNENETIIDITNAGEATSQGIELDLNYQLSEAFSFHINAVTLQARFDKFDNATGEGDSFANNSLPYAPELSAYVGVEYRDNISSKAEITFQLDYSYSDTYFSSPNNEELFQVDSYHQTNASVALRLAQRWTISIWGKNLGDETYLKYRDISFAGVQRGYFAPPRSYGITLAVN